jgi:hypothetical protein
MLDLAKVMIMAEDRTKEATDSAVRNLQGVHSEVDSFAGKWKALGGLLGITAFARIVKDAIDAQAKIKDLAIEAGMTVEQLTRFEEVGRTSGEGLEGIASAMGKLSRSLLEARDPTTAQAAALRAINLSWRELNGLSPDEQLIKIAQALAQFGPSLEKNAAVMALFAKSGAKFQVTLGEVAEAQKLAATTTQAQADGADAFNDALAKLGLRFAKFGRQIANEVLEYLNPLLQAFTEMPTTATSTLGVIDLLAGSFKYLGGMIGTAWFTLVDFGDALGAIAAKAVSFFKGDWAGIQEINRARAETAAKNDEALGRFWARLQGTLKEEITLKKDLRKIDYNPGGDKARDDELKQYQAASMELERQSVLRRERERLGRDLTEAERTLAEIELGKYANLTPAHQAELKAKAQLEVIEEARARIGRADFEARMKEAEVLGKGLEALNEKVEAAKLENDTYGLSRVQIEQVTIARLEERRAMLMGVEGAELQIRAIESEIDRRRELVKEYQRSEVNEQLRAQMSLQSQVWDEAASRGASFFVDLATNGRKAFKNLREEIKAFGRELVAIFMKRWILQMGANLTGNAALNTMAGQVGQGTLAGSALNWLGTGTGAVSSAFAGGSEFLSAATGNFMGPAMPGSAAGMGQSVYAFMTNPVTIAVLAAVAIAVVLQARRGGPKEGGSFFGGYDARGNFTGDLTVPGSDNGRFYTPNGGDALAREAGQAVAGSFFDILRRLGGTTQGIQLGIGYDKDPRGSADSRVTALVRDASGRVLYSNTSTAGRDDEDFERVMSLETRRAILAGLQGSDLPEAIANILNGVAVSTATSEQIDRVFALAEAMRTLLDTMAPLSVEDLVGEASRSALEAWRAQGAQLRELSENTDLSTESLQRLAQATGQYRAAAAQLILQFEAARRSVSAGIEDTIRDMRFQTLDRQGQYDMLRGEADTLISQVGTMEDAQQIAEAMNRIRQLSSQAFGMLSDEERRAMFPQYEAGLREAQRQADERLVSLRNQVRDEANEQLRQQREAVTEMTKAATAMDKATLRFEAAVRDFSGTEIPVTVHVEKSDFEVQPG